MSEAWGILLICLTAAEVKDPLADLQRFPPHRVAAVQYLIAKNREETFKVEWVIATQSDWWIGVVVINESSAVCQHPLVTRPETREWASGHYHRLRVERLSWYYLRMAANTERERGCREKNLAALRLILGEDNWAAGQMPWPY